MEKYKVAGRGNRWTYGFETIEAARQFANQIFERTGIVAAVHAYRTRKER